MSLQAACVGSPVVSSGYQSVSVASLCDASSTFFGWCNPAQLVEEVEDERDVVLLRALCSCGGYEGESLTVGMQVEHAVWTARNEMPAGPEPRLLGAKRVALHRVRSHHDLSVGIAVEELLFRARPGRIGPATGRDLPLTAGPRERLRIHFIASCLIRPVRKPSSVERENRLALCEGTVREHTGRAGLPARHLISLQRQNHQIEIRLRRLLLDREQLAARMPRRRELRVPAVGEALLVTGPVDPPPIEVHRRFIRAC